MAKVAAKPAYAAPRAGVAAIRITKLGDGRVSNGVHHPVLGDEYYEAGEVVENVPRAIATELEARGLAEIQMRAAPSPGSGREGGK